MNFNKSPKIVGEQIGLLQSSGLVMNDCNAADHYLAHLNYYRLAAYWLLFKAYRLGFPEDYGHMNYWRSDGEHTT
jgi:abortive infection bacteriophage resistance protein